MHTSKKSFKEDDAKYDLILEAEDVDDQVEKSKANSNDNKENQKSAEVDQEAPVPQDEY